MISVIIPTYNRNQVLRDIIKQILNQDYLNFELIVIDQSKNHDKETTEYLSSVLNKIKYFQIEPPNLPAARNFGIKKAKGEIIVFFDDDMIITEDTLIKIGDAFGNDFINALTGFVLYPSQLEKTKWLIVRKKKCINGRYYEIKAFGGYFMCFRKLVFETVGYFDEWIGTQPLAAAEDYEFSRRVRVNDIKLFLDSSITLVHLGEKAGGCGRRNLNSDVIEIEHMKMFCYSVLKNRKFRNFIGKVISIIECYKPFLFSKSIKGSIFNRIFSLNKIIQINLKQIEQRID